jgi:hypothetical protein
VKHFFALALSLASLLFISCKSTSTTAPPDTSKGTPTADGTPVGTPSSATIDATGGSLMSPDGRLEVIIPANALSAATTISVQPVSNETPLGAGLGFELLPNGQTFNVPVTLRFHYDSTDLLGTDANAFAIATQKANHIWYRLSNQTLDPDAETVSITTTHFSAYNMYHSLRLIPYHDEIEVNNTSLVAVVFVVEGEADETGYPLSPYAFYAVPSQISWSVNGSPMGTPENGMLVSTPGVSSATYTAPATTANMTSNPAAVTATVDIPGKGAMHLISNINVLGGDSIRTFKVTVKFTGVEMIGMDFKYGYEDEGSFIATLYPEEDSARISSITNSNGKITGWTETNPICTHTPGGAGNYLNIVSAHCPVMLHAVGSDRLFVYIESAGTTFSLTTDCGSNPKTTPAGKVNNPYSAFPFLLNGSAQSIDDATAGNWPGVTVTFTVTPQ